MVVTTENIGRNYHERNLDRIKRKLCFAAAIANANDRPPMLIALDFSFFLNKTSYFGVKTPLSWCLVRFPPRSAMDRSNGRGILLARGSSVRLLQLIET